MLGAGWEGWEAGKDPDLPLRIKVEIASYLLRGKMRKKNHEICCISEELQEIKANRECNLGVNVQNTHLGNTRKSMGL